MFFSRIDLCLTSLPLQWKSCLEHGLEYAIHQWIWKFFESDDKRNFLYRAKQKVRFIEIYVLSTTQPAQLMEDGISIATKSFSPVFRPEQKLFFELIVVPRYGIATKGKKHSLLMNYKFTHKEDLQNIKKSNGDVMRGSYLEVNNWLTRTGQRTGFKVENFSINALNQHTFRNREHRISFDSIDLQGILSVTDPDLFLETLVKGVGAEKSFGFGLILLRSL